MAGWSDQGFLLLTRPYGEHLCTVHVLTKNNGHVRSVSTAGKRKGAPLQKGMLYACAWRARKEEGLGFIKMEALPDLPFFELMRACEKSLALLYLCHLCVLLLPEREAVEGAYAQFDTARRELGSQDAHAVLLGFEHFLLQALGYAFFDGRVDLGDALAFKKAAQESGHLIHKVLNHRALELERKRLFHHVL